MNQFNILPYNGKRDEWDNWANMFIAFSNMLQQSDILLGLSKTPTKADELLDYQQKTSEL